MNEQISVYSWFVLGGRKWRSASCWKISATFDEWRSAPGEKGEAITMHKAGGETNTALNTFPLMTTRANPANSGLRQALGDRLCVRALFCSFASPVRHQLMPGSDRLVFVIRAVQSGIAIVTVVVMTTLEKLEPPSPCGAIHIYPVPFFHCQVFFFSFYSPARTFVFASE